MEQAGHVVSRTENAATEQPNIAIYHQPRRIMDCAWNPSKAKVEDASAIASLLAMSWTSPFARLQFGYVDPVILTASMAQRIAQQMELSNVAFIGIRNPLTQEIVSVAQWMLPADDVATMKETLEEQDERQAFDDELYRSSLPADSNKDLIMEFTIGLRALKQRALQGHQHYALENLATHPDYRGRGFATRLVKWVFQRADMDNKYVYLETDSNNPAIRMYRRLGFEEKGRHVIENLHRFGRRQETEEHGGAVEHTHVAYVRVPEYGHEK